MIKSPVDNKIEFKRGHCRKTEGVEGMLNRSFEVDVMGATKNVPVMRERDRMKSYYEKRVSKPLRTS